ncbi:MAG: Homeodomain-like domain [Chloroflexota bacterium]|jgi:transposase-like protein
MSGIRRAWPLSVRSTAIKMLQEGYTTPEVSRKTGVPEKTIDTWAFKYKIQRGTSRPLNKSGVVAPSAYHRGSRWWCD